MIQLVRPSEKGVDNPEGVNESVSQNAGPKVATGDHVRSSQDQSCNAGIDHTSRTFVIMPVTKQDRNEHNPDPISRYRSASNISCTRQEISAVRDLFAERGKRPHQQQSNQRDLHVPGNLVCQCRRNRLRPEKARHRFDYELPRRMRKQQLPAQLEGCAAMTPVV